MSANQVDPCLLAIILTISTHSGPQFVFHYPPQPDTHEYKAAAPLSQKESELVSDSSNYEDSSTSSNQEDEELDDSGSSDSHSGHTSQSTIRQPHPPPSSKGRTATGSLLARLESTRRSRGSETGLPSLDEKKTASNDSSRRSSIGGRASSITTNSESWHKVLGFECDFLSELLCPPRGMCNAKFEMTVDDMVFLGIPVHIRPDGNWKQPKTRTLRDGGKSSVPSTLVGNKKKRRAKSNGGTSIGTAGSRTSPKTPSAPDSDESGADGDDEKNSDQEGIMEDDEEEGETNNLPTSPVNEDEEEPKADYIDPKSPMRMFHVAFVTNPPLIEYNSRISEMFHCVVANFTRCLRSEQAKNNYVWREASTMLAVRDRADGLTNGQLWAETKTKSELGRAIAQLFDSISTSSIANVVINGKLRSFQIPLVSVFYKLPELTQSISHLQVSHLTSTTPYVDIEEEANRITGHFAILLLDEPEQIIKNIRADPFSPLAAFIRAITPQHSIQTLAGESGWSVDDVIELTNSLIYWRKARAISPLHHRNTYIVSPLANMKKLYDYIPMFREKFPTLPPLPRLLSMLSTGKMKPISSIIPSRDHREIYLMAVGWLMRYGLVCQLRSFVWLKVTRRIKLVVSREIEIEEEEQKVKKTAEKDHNDKPKMTKTDTSTDNSSKGGGQSPHFKAAPPRVGFRIDEEPEDDEDERFFLDDFMEDTIIQDPERASSIERKWLAKMVEDKPEDVQNLFHRTMKYFNGRYTIERIMVLQGLTRYDMKKLTSALEDYVVVTRHW